MSLLTSIMGPSKIPVFHTHSNMNTEPIGFRESRHVAMSTGITGVTGTSEAWADTTPRVIHHDKETEAKINKWRMKAIEWYDYAIKLEKMLGIEQPTIDEELTIE